MKQSDDQRQQELAKLRETRLPSSVLREIAEKLEAAKPVSA